LMRASPSRKREEGAARLETARRALDRFMLHALDRKRRQWNENDGRLHSLSPMGVLSRGYSITRQLPSGKIIRDAGATRAGDLVEIVLGRGELDCRVETVRPPSGRKDQGSG